MDETSSMDFAREKLGVDDYYRWALDPRWPLVRGQHCMAARWDEVLTRRYGLARLRAARETNLPLRDFPQNRPFDQAEIMEADYSIGE